jgi:hypothetical protein
MGDRANVFVVEDGGSNPPVGVYLYSHCDGTELPRTLQAALRRKLRWDDGQYLARIIFCEMIRGHEAGDLHFGISARVYDGADRVIYVEPGKQRVTISPLRSWSFEEFCESDPTTLNW